MMGREDVERLDARISEVKAQLPEVFRQIRGVETWASDRFTEIETALGITCCNNCGATVLAKYLTDGSCPNCVAARK
jgi:rubrerythrin